MDQILSKVADGSVTDAQLAGVLKSMSKELRGKAGTIPWILDTLLPLLSCPSVLIEHIILFLSEDSKEEILLLVDKCQQLVDEDRTVVISVLGTLGDLAALLSSSFAFQTGDLQDVPHQQPRQQAIPSPVKATNRMGRLKRGEKRLTPKINTHTRAASSSSSSSSPLDSIRSKIFHLCVNSMDLVDVDNLPTLIRTLLFSLTPSNASAGFQSLRNATQRFTPADMAPILPVLHTALRLTPKLATSFLLFFDSLPLALPIDIHILTMVLNSTVPHHVERAWKGLESAILRKALPLQLLRLFAIDASLYGHHSEDFCSETILFNIFEHLLHTPNPFMADIATNFATTLFFHFPSLRMQLLESLLSSSFTLLIRSSTDLEVERLNDTRSGKISISLPTASKSTLFPQPTKIKSLYAHWSTESWRFPLRSVLEMCSKFPKLVVPFHHIVEDSFLQWSQRGVTGSIEKMNDMERRHWVTHMHSMAASIVSLTPFRLGLFSTLLMLIQKLLCSGNAMSQSSGIILAQHTIQSRWIEEQDSRVVYSHLLTNCPTMKPKVRIFYYELITTCSHNIAKDQLEQTAKLVSAAIAKIGLLSTSTHQVSEEDLYYKAGLTQQSSYTSRRQVYFDVETLATWLQGTSGSAAASASHSSSLSLEHAQQLLRCHMIILRQLDPLEFESLIRAPLYMGPDWRFCLDTIGRVQAITISGEETNSRDAQILEATGEMLTLATTILETLSQVITDDRLLHVLQSLNQGYSSISDQEEATELSYTSLVFKSSILPLQREILVPLPAKHHDEDRDDEETYHNRHCEIMVQLLDERTVSILECHQLLNDIFCSVPIAKSSLSTPSSSFTGKKALRSKGEAGQRGNEKVTLPKSSYLIPMNVAWSLLIHHHHFIDSIQQSWSTPGGNGLKPKRPETHLLLNSCLASIQTWFSMTIPIPMTITDSPENIYLLANVAIVSYHNLPNFCEISRKSTELDTFFAAPSQYLFSPLELFSMSIQSILPKDTYTPRNESSSSTPNFVLRFGSSGTGPNLLSDLITSSSLLWIPFDMIAGKTSASVDGVELDLHSPALCTSINILLTLIAFSYQLDNVTLSRSSPTHYAPQQSRLLVELSRSFGYRMTQNHDQSDREVCHLVFETLASELLRLFPREQAFTPLLFSASLLLCLLDPICVLAHQKFPQVLELILKKQFMTTTHPVAIMTRALCWSIFHLSQTGCLVLPVELHWVIISLNAINARSEWRVSILTVSEEVVAEMSESDVAGPQSIFHPVFQLITQETVGGLCEDLLNLDLSDLKHAVSVGGASFEFRVQDIQHPLSYYASTLNRAISLLNLCDSVSSISGFGDWRSKRSTRLKLVELAQALRPLLLASVAWRQSGIERMHDNERGVSVATGATSSSSVGRRNEWQVSILTPIFSASDRLLTTISKFENQYEIPASEDLSHGRGARRKVVPVKKSVRKAQLSLKYLSNMHHVDMNRVDVGGVEEDGDRGRGDDADGDVANVANGAFFGRSSVTGEDGVYGYGERSVLTQKDDDDDDDDEEEENATFGRARHRRSAPSLSDHLPQELNGYQPSRLSEAEKQHVIVLMPRRKKVKRNTSSSSSAAAAIPTAHSSMDIDDDEDFHIVSAEEQFDVATLGTNGGEEFRQPHSHPHPHHPHHPHPHPSPHPSAPSALPPSAPSRSTAPPPPRRSSTLGTTPVTPSPDASPIPPKPQRSTVPLSIRMKSTSMVPVDGESSEEKANAATPKPHPPPPKAKTKAKPTGASTAATFPSTSSSSSPSSSSSSSKNNSTPTTTTTASAYSSSSSSSSSSGPSNAKPFIAPSSPTTKIVIDDDEEEDEIGFQSDYSDKSGEM